MKTAVQSGLIKMAHDSTPKKEMLLSIIVPVYNVEAYLPHCLDSICTQLDAYERRVEVWVINDGSPDNCQLIISRYEKEYPHLIRVIVKENGGLSDARNAAMDKACGRFIWFVDSDDSLEPGALKEILPFLEQTDADYIYFNACRVDSNDRIIGRFNHGRKTAAPIQFNFSYRAVQDKFSTHMVWLRIFRRDFIGALRFPKGITHEDIHFDLQLLANQPKILYLDGIYYRHFYDNPDSITNTMSPEKFRHVLWTFKDLSEKFYCDHRLVNLIDEFRLIAIDTIFSRACFLVSTCLPGYEKCKLFLEYAEVIKKFLNSNKRHLPVIFPGIFTRLMLFLIRRGHFALAYSLVNAATRLKAFYDSITASRYVFKRMIIKHLVGFSDPGHF